MIQLICYRFMLLFLVFIFLFANDSHTYSRIASELDPSHCQTVGHLHSAGEANVRAGVNGAEQVAHCGESKFSIATSRSIPVPDAEIKLREGDPDRNFNFPAIEPPPPRRVW